MAFPKRPTHSYSLSSDSYTKQFTSYADQLAIWSVNDQKKLTSMDNLYARSMDFHKNVHSKESTLKIFSSIDIGDPKQYFQSNHTVANVMTFRNDKSAKLIQKMTFSQFFKFAHEKFEESSEDANSLDTTTTTPIPEYFWIHLKDLKVLPVLINVMKMHEMIAGTFYDLRQHTNFVKNEHEIFFSNVICLLDDNNFRMFKFYIYMKDNVLITYEVKLFPDIEEKMKNQEIAEIGKKYTSTPFNTTVATSSSSKHKKDKVNDDDQLGSSSSSSIFIADKILKYFSLHLIKLKKKIFELGIFYMVYEISLYFQLEYNSAIEFLSYSLSYFNRIIHLNLLHGERMAILLKIHMISASISLIKKAIEENVGTYESLFSFAKVIIRQKSFFEMNNSVSNKENRPSNNINIADPGEGNGGKDIDEEEEKRLEDLDYYTVAISVKEKNVHSHLSSRHSLYLIDLVNSCHFKLQSIRSLNDEKLRIETELNKAIELRTLNTNSILSIVTTTFLPLTFLTAVYGMNFVEDGGFSMEILNVKYGPDLFYALCFASIFLSVSSFIYFGWLEYGIFITLFKKLNKVNFFDDSLEFDDSDHQGELSEEALQRAEEEDQRRRAEANFMRSAGNAFELMQLGIQHATITMNDGNNHNNNSSRKKFLTTRKLSFGSSRKSDSRSYSSINQEKSQKIFLKEASNSSKGPKKSAAVSSLSSVSQRSPSSMKSTGGIEMSKKLSLKLKRTSSLSKREGEENEEDDQNDVVK